MESFNVVYPSYLVREIEGTRTEPLFGLVYNTFALFVECVTFRVSEH